MLWKTTQDFRKSSPKLPKYVANILINPLGLFVSLFTSAILINPHDVPLNQMCGKFYPPLTSRKAYL